MAAHSEHNNSTRQGMTLIEVIFAMGIFVVVVLATLSGLMSTITTNRILTANATANAAILHQREEMQEIAATDAKAPAAAIVKHYAQLATIGNDSGDNGIAVGANGQSVAKVRWDNQNRGLVYTFEIPGPAESVSSAAGHEPFTRGFGEMLIYLNEAAIPVDRPVAWDDLGNGGGGSTAGGYDINGDKTIANRLTAGAINNLEGKNFAAFNDEVQPLRLPVDITVKYFSDASHSQLFFETTRRSVFVGLNTDWMD